MDDLLTSSDNNTGGLTSVKFAPVHFFLSINPLVFVTGYDWITLQATSETMQFDEQTQETDNLDNQSITITATLPKIRPQVHAILKKYRLAQSIVRTSDNNGYLRLAGNPDEPLTLYDQSNTGKAAADPNSYTITFKGVTRYPALFI